MSALGNDPRFVEHREARALTEQGLSAPDGARERYRRSITPYVECLAEHANQSPISRKHLMRALIYDSGLPLGIVAGIFKATEEEGEFVRADPPTQPEPVDEIDRLQRLPYGVYLKTEHWKKVRAAALERAGHRCMLCNDRVGPLEVHHRSYERRGCERPTDVYALCASCHSRHHGTLRGAA